MNEGAYTLAEEYAAAMRDYLAGSGEVALRRSYQAGRRALSEGVGVLEMVAAHQESLIGALRSQSPQPDPEEILLQAVSCFAESLAPFEMVLRGAQEANARLQQGLESLQSVEEQLRCQNEELTAAQGALEKERSRYQALFDFAPDGYLVTGFEGAIREANTAAAALLNTPQELLPGQSLSEFVVHTGRDEFRERLRGLHAGTLGRVEDWQTTLRPRNLPPIPAALTVVAERSVPAIASLRWLIRDVTERKRLEKERTRWLVGQARARAARRFEFLAEASAVLVGPLDVEASLSSVAHLTTVFLGGWCFISVVEPDGSLRQLEVAHADASAADLATELRRHCLFGGTANGDCSPLLDHPQIVQPLTEEWYNRAADGPSHAALLRRLRGGGAMTFPLHFHNRLLGILTVISPFGSPYYRSSHRILAEDLARRCALALENARLYREVVAERDKAERASRAKDEFVAILGHELRNPLTPIVGWTRTFKNHSLISQDPLLAEGVRAMERNAMTLTRLIGDCTDLARISEGKIQIERALVDLNQIAAVSFEATREMAAERGLRLRADLTPEPLPVLGDAVRLEQVVMNLLINALKFTESGGLISIRTALSDAEARLEVADTGIGIDGAFLEQIFEPFRQGTAAWLTSQSGVGLGLAIAQRIVKVHGGRVWAESPGLGCGSTFHIRLPMAARTEEGCCTEAPAVLMADQGNKIRILLIEDSEDILFLMKADLEKMGHTVLTAANGRLGIEAARVHRPDLIVSDVKMPIVDGYELIRAVRDAAELRGTPAIALTGFGAQVDFDRALSAGFNACLSKPVEPEKIADLIRNLTGNGDAVPDTHRSG
ncbi:MAG TPA: ATP-binding protein [Bryobacteraceae bacterium]|nr:ATP-binding protein [Bryobacteraceae bacterium]